MAIDDLEQLYREKDSVQILDVREPYEWEAGHIEGALHVPLARVMAGEGTEALDPGQPVFVICRMGNRSELAATMLRARGYDARNVTPGMEGWAAAGLPFVASDGGPGTVA